MSCADNRLLHSALLDGELAADERAQVEAHLATCAECTAELAALARTLGMLHALPATRAPLGFVDRVLEAARPMPWHRRWGRRLFQPRRVKLPLEAAAVVLVALGAVYVFQSTPELQRAARQEPPASAPVPVTPPATPAPPTVPAVTGTPAPSQSAPAEAHRQIAEVDQTEKKKEREGALADAPAKAASPPARSATRPETRLEGREATPQAKKDAQMARGAMPGGRSDSREAPAASGNLMKDAMKDAAPGQTPAAAPAPPVGASAPPAAAQPEIAAAPPAAPGVPAPPTIAAPAPEAREKSGARSQSEVSRPLEGARPPESKSGELSARTRQLPASLFVAPDVSGRLSVGNRAAADRALADLGERLGVAQAFRREEPDGALIEWIVPREVYAEFVRGLAGIGRWTAEREPATLPTRVRVQVRVGS